MLILATGETEIKGIDASPPLSSQPPKPGTLFDIMSMVHVCMPMCVMFGADFLHSMLLPISVFGTIFKIDSTKKAAKKLLGSAANSAS